MTSPRFKKVVCAYSGGLDTSVMIPWLKENYGCEIITYTGDLGQGEDLSGIRAKALRTGASDAVVDDLQDRFVHEFIWPAVKASALYEGQYPLHTALGRPLLARRLVEVAREFGADAIALSQPCRLCLVRESDDAARVALRHRDRPPDERRVIDTFHAHVKVVNVQMQDDARCCRRRNYCRHSQARRQTFKAARQSEQAD